ncbi:MAG: hypothetical protein WBZ36_06590 [Candidatus Nitrosopolaris sp.]
MALTIFGEKLNRIGYIAIALVLVGVIIVTTNLQFDSSLLKINAGNLLIIGATLFWGLDNNISRILTHRIYITKIIQLGIAQWPFEYRLRKIISSLVLLISCENYSSASSNK